MDRWADARMLGWVNEWISEKVDGRADRILWTETQANVSGLPAAFASGKLKMMGPDFSFPVWSVNRGPERPAEAVSSAPHQDPVISHAPPLRLWMEV